MPLFLPSRETNSIVLRLESVQKSLLVVESTIKPLGRVTLLSINMVRFCPSMPALSILAERPQSLQYIYLSKIRIKLDK